MLERTKRSRKSEEEEELLEAVAWPHPTPTFTVARLQWHASRQRRGECIMLLFCVCVCVVRWLGWHKCTDKGKQDRLHRCFRDTNCSCVNLNDAQQKKKATCRAIKRTSFFFCLLKDEMKRTFNHTDEKKKKKNWPLSKTSQRRWTP